jgi:predicted nucleic acid-binding protein
MILYLDTSSLVKLYLEEAYSEAVHHWAQEAEILATSRVAYPETLAALSRRWREGDLDEAAFQRVVDTFKAQWLAFAALDLNEMVAGALAITHALRGFDAVHLAAALDLRREVVDTPVAFTAFDSRLTQAARAEGFQVLDTEAI